MQSQPRYVELTQNPQHLARIPGLAPPRLSFWCTTGPDHGYGSLAMLLPQIPRRPFSVDGVLC
jgi:hypothetical protein